MTLLRLGAGLKPAAATQLIKQRMQTACWQLCFSDRFTGARNPARLNKPIPSRRNLFAPFWEMLSSFTGQLQFTT